MLADHGIAFHSRVRRTGSTAPDFFPCGVGMTHVPATAQAPQILLSPGVWDIEPEGISKVIH